MIFFSYLVFDLINKKKSGRGGHSFKILKKLIVHLVLLKVLEKQFLHLAFFGYESTKNIKSVS